MKLTLGAALALLSSSALVSAQTYTNCNPLQKTCPADPALGKADQKFDFSSGSSSEFKASGSVTYDDTNGATFTVAKQGDGPLIQSNWYIMFGRVEFSIKAAPGTGIVSSAVLQSDDLDEIDWEWLGGKSSQVQTNYFGKGDTSSYNRGAFHDNPGGQDSFQTYSIDWSSTQIIWAIDGKTVRVLTPDTADANQYPQTPMMVKVGVWAGGDSNNAQGTIDWAGGETDYSSGPYNMYLKSMTVTDYSTGNSYSYGDKTGDWTSISADGGKVNGNSADEPTSTESAPAITATVESIPVPWSGTHKETSSWVTPNVWPWVATGEPSSTGAHTSKWESRSNHIQPPSGGSSTFLSTSVHSVSSPAVFSPSGLKSSTTQSSRHTSKTTTTKKNGTRTAETEEATATTTTKNPNAAPSVNTANSQYQVPTNWSIFCAIVGSVLFGGTVLLL
ncbi:hypothetical protein N7450_002843 [Penicillium hetheringtonii]|uniref:Crh-like protein n=1 Tax=Penicillium hetheringtonii TaxID=911720 RepID=A0AAD6DWN2_9EURO|nr:hypothetical protein N7450_002843 [Penicillium hetheringtonii]